MLWVELDGVTMRKFLERTRYDVLVGLGPVFGGGLAGWLTRDLSSTTQIISVALGGIIFLIAFVAIAQILRPRFEIKSNSLRSVFAQKLNEDIKRFEDSDTAMRARKVKMLSDSRRVIQAADLDPLLAASTVKMKQVEKWLSDTQISEIPFTEIITKKHPDKVIRELVARVSKATDRQPLVVNTSTVEPGCVALVEKLKSFGLRIVHEFDDINGIDQASSLISERPIAASFVPYSTIFMSEFSPAIVGRFSFMCPINTEDQQILAKRDITGRYDLSNIAVPNRGSGHFQLMVMKNAEIIDHSVGNVVDINHFSSSITNDGSILYEPVASIALETKSASEPWGFVTSDPYHVDLILVANDQILGGASSAFRQLVIFAMWVMKNEHKSNAKLAKKLYKIKPIKRAFEHSHDHLLSILRK